MTDTTARAALIAYAAGTRTVTADGLDPLIDAVIAEAAPASAPSVPADRAALSAKLWAVAEHHIVAEWICCEPLEPGHRLCAKGYAALGMAKSLLVDGDPEKAWNPEAPLLNAVLAELAADAEAHRLALSTALGLGTGAPWDAIRVRAAELAGQGVAEDRGSDERDDIQVWPLARVLAEVRCGSHDWSWDEEWADLDRRHAETGYLAKLEQQIAENGITMPVLVGSDGRLWDGHHRLRVAVRLGIGYVPVEITPPAAAPVAGQPPEDTGEEAREETVHARPGPDDNGISPCCGRPPFEFRGERLTRDPALVTCPTSPAVVAEPGKESDAL